MPISKDLLYKLYKGFKENEDINNLLREVSKENFLAIFKMRHKKNRDMILGFHESLKVEQVQAVLNRAKELGISFEEIVKEIIFPLNFDSKEKKQKYISLIGLIKNPDFKFLSGVVHAINEIYGLELLWESISKDDRERIKTKLGGDEHKDVLDEINRIETTIATKNQPVQTGNIEDDNLSETDRVDSNVTVIGDSVHTTEKISSTEKNLYLDLQNAIDKKEDIAEILKGATKEDLLDVFLLFKQKKEDEGIENTNFTCNILHDKEYRLALFNAVKEKGILGEFLSINLVYVGQRFQPSDNEENVPNVGTEYKLADFIASSTDDIFVLDEIKEVFGFKEFWKASSKEDRNMIKGALKREIDDPDNEQKDQCKDFLEEIEEIEFQILSNSVVYKTPILDFGDNRELRKNAAKKGMKFGAIGGAITALAAGLGLYFGTSAALTVLPTIIGIALVTALLVGATIGAITYDVLKPKSCVDTVYVFKKFDTIKQETNTAASIAV